MSFALFIRRSTFVAVALSLTTFGATTMPAAAWTLTGKLPPPKLVFNPGLLNPIINPIVKPPKLPPPVINPPKIPVGPVTPINICAIMPSKCVKPIVVVGASPVVVEEVVRAGSVYVPHAVSTEVAATNCNCLTKQYQTDGSVIFRDVCTHEAAMATPEDLKAQKQAQAQAAQEQTPAQAQAAAQTQPAPAH
jgi:hypothetical protein